MEIKKFYKESNEISDISGDYVIIKMSFNTYSTLKNILRNCYLYGDKLETISRIIAKELDEEFIKAKAEWY